MIKKLFNYEVALGSSILSNVCCLFYIQQQNKQANELISKYNQLLKTVSTLNSNFTKIEEELSAAVSTKTAPIFINTSESVFFSKPLLVSCLLVASLGFSYYLSTAVVTKVSTVTIPKLISISSIIAKLPFFEQTKEITVFLKDVSTTLLIKTLNDNVLSVDFRHINDAHFTSIIKAIEVYLEAERNKLSIEESSPLFRENVETVADTMKSLSNLF